MVGSEDSLKGPVPILRKRKAFEIQEEVVERAHGFAKVEET